jgi:anti-anti-sigma regulatory factor
MKIDMKYGEHLFELSGNVTGADIPELRVRLAEALSGGQHDLMFDARRVTTFDDAALTALTAARSKAKSQHHRIVALDRDEGALTMSLRRTGLIFRFPVYRDATTAAAALTADRAELAAKGRIPAQHIA